MAQLEGSAGGGVSRKKKTGGAAGSGIKKKSTGAAGSAATRRLSGGTSGGGGGSVRNYSYGGGEGGGVSSNSSGQYSRPAAPPSAPAGGAPVPSIGQYLGRDSGYGQSIRQLDKSWLDFVADVTRRRGSLQSEYGLSRKAMGDQRTRDLESLEEDYSSRGLLRSGLYADATGDYEKEYGTRMSDLQRRQNEALSQLMQERGQFASQTNLQKQAAKEAAIRRRAEQYGV